MFDFIPFHLTFQGDVGEIQTLSKIAAKREVALFLHKSVSNCQNHLLSLALALLQPVPAGQGPSKELCVSIKVLHMKSRQVVWKSSWLRGRGKNENTVGVVIALRLASFYGQATPAVHA